MNELEMESRLAALGVTTREEFDRALLHACGRELATAPRRAIGIRDVAAILFLAAAAALLISPALHRGDEAEPEHVTSRDVETVTGRDLSPPQRIVNGVPATGSDVEPSIGGVTSHGRTIFLGAMTTPSAREMVERAFAVVKVRLPPLPRTAPLEVEVLTVFSGPSELKGRRIELVYARGEDAFWGHERSPLEVVRLADSAFDDTRDAEAALVALEPTGDPAEEGERFFTWLAPYLEGVLVPRTSPPATTMPLSSPTEAAVAALDLEIAAAMSSSSPVIRKGAADAARRMRGGFPLSKTQPRTISPEQRAALLKGLTDPDAAVRWSSGLALYEVDGDDVTEALTRLLFDRCRIARQPASMHLRRVHAGASIPSFAPLAGLEDYALDEGASEPMRQENRRFHTKVDAGYDIGLLAHDQSSLRERAAWALADSAADPAAVSALLGALSDPEAEVRRAAAWSLGSSIGGQAVTAALRGLAHDADLRVTAAAARSLARLHDASASGLFSFVVHSGDARAAVQALEFLGEVGDSTSMLLLETAAASANPASRAAAILASADIASREPASPGSSARSLAMTLVERGAADSLPFVRLAADVARGRLVDR